MVFTEDTIQKVWEKGFVASKYDPKIWRKDQCGAWIARSDYGKRNSQYGWEINHIKPESEGGGNELSNLRLLQWENNASKQNGLLTCPVTALGTHNISSK
jgi:hypothetical protein